MHGAVRIAHLIDRFVGKQRVDNLGFLQADYVRIGKLRQPAQMPDAQPHTVNIPGYDAHFRFAG